VVTAVSTPARVTVDVLPAQEPAQMLVFLVLTLELPWKRVVHAHKTTMENAAKGTLAPAPQHVIPAQAQLLLNVLNASLMHTGLTTHVRAMTTGQAHIAMFMKEIAQPYVMDVSMRLIVLIV